MRDFIRHPLDIPIDYSLEELVKHETDYIKDISEGGLCFRSHKYIQPETVIHVKIPLKKPEFEATGIVAWCKVVDDHFEAGVNFMDKGTEFSVRMIEQVCHIEHYKKEVASNEGRNITDEEAALEWITRFAKDFPR